MKNDAKFWDKIAQKYAKRPISDQTAYEHKLAKTQEYFDEQSRVLELGCGTASTALLHAPYVKHITATDISQQMINIGQQKVAESGFDNIELRCGSVEALQFDEPFDVILALNLFHLLEDVDGALSKIQQWLKPGGVLITSTACLGDSLAWFKIVGPIGRWLGFFPYVNVFTEAALQSKLSDKGFELEYRWRPKKSPVTFLISRYR